MRAPKRKPRAFAEQAAAETLLAMLAMKISGTDARTATIGIHNIIHSNSAQVTGGETVLVMPAEHASTAF